MKRKPPFRNIYMSSIHQNAGKTTMSLGLFRALKNKKLRTAYMKPVGQEVVKMGDVRVDKDSYLFGEVYKAGGRHFREMSPITIGPGYTEKYIKNPNSEKLKKKITKSFDILTKGRNAIIVEGTGHAGVGSVIDCSNAEVARLLGSKVIIICEGGIGKSIDEVSLNKALFDLLGVEVLGVIINKVIPEKYSKIKATLTRGFRQKGINVLGVIPIDPLLSAPTIDQVANRLRLKMLCGRQARMRRVRNTIVAAMEPHNMINYLKDGTLVLTSGDRVDNILAAVSSHLVSHDGKSFRIAGLILTGGLIPNPMIIDLLKKSQMPVLLTDDDTYTVAAELDDLICKIQKSDKDKIEEASNLVKKYVDVKMILDSFQ